MVLGTGPACTHTKVATFRRWKVSTPAKRWWIYSRFSSDMQSPRSCDDQERECREAAQRLGLGPVEADRDAAVRAGAIANRDGWNRIMTKARAGLVDGIMFEEISRFSRDFLDGFAVLAELNRLGVRIADTKLGVINKLLHPSGSARSLVLECTDEAALFSHGIDHEAREELRRGDVETFFTRRNKSLRRSTEEFFARNTELKRDDAPPIAALTRRSA